MSNISPEMNPVKTLHCCLSLCLLFLVPAQLTVLSVPSSKRWQEISARRMELIQNLIEEKLQNHIDYIFCLDVDSQFHGRWGTESLGRLVPVIHPGQCTSPSAL